MNCRTLNNEYVSRFGVCPVCDEEHWYQTQKHTLGKLDAYTLRWKSEKDRMRTKHHNDLLQPIVNGKENKEFIKVYGKPKINI